MTNKNSCDNCSLCNNKSTCFEQLNDDEFEFINTKRVEIKYKKGEVIAKQGSFATHILFLKKGLVKVYKEINNEHNLILSFFPEKNLIGLPALFGNEILQYSVAAIEDSTICAIDKKRFEELVAKNSEFAIEIIKTINHCTLFNFEKIVSLTQKQLNGRLADTFLFLANDIYKDDTFKLSLSRKDIAEFAGLSVMSVVRGIKDFKESGLISNEKGVIEILKKEALERISVSG